MMSKAIFFLDENATYKGPEPNFFNPADYEWTEQLESNWKIIKEEFEYPGFKTKFEIVM